MRHPQPLFRLVGPLLSMFAVLAAPLALTAAEREALRMYDVTDLMQRPNDMSVPALGIVADAPLGVHAGGVVVPTAQGDRWDAFIARSFTPEIAPLIRAHAEFRAGSTMFLTACPELHQHVEQVFAELRRQCRFEVRIAARMYLMAPQLRREVFSFAGLPWKPIAGAPGRMSAEVSAAELEIMQSTLGKPGNGVACVAAPSITSWLGQRAFASYTHEVAYVPVFSGAPRRNVVTLGEVLGVRSTVTPDHLLISLDITHSVCALVELRSIDLGHGDKAEEPVLWNGGETLTQTLPVGRSVVLATGVYLDGKEPRVGFLTITPTLLDLDAPAETAIVR